MAHNIEGFEIHKEYIETKPFYMKYCGMISVKNKGIITAETEKAILFREKIQIDKEEYSTNPYWISKSLIVKRETL